MRHQIVENVSAIICNEFRLIELFPLFSSLALGEHSFGFNKIALISNRIDVRAINSCLFIYLLCYGVRVVIGLNGSPNIIKTTTLSIYNGERLLAVVRDVVVVPSCCF